MDKYELAQYLVNLHTLLSAQASGAHSVPSATLSAEYERSWALLKEEIERDAKQEREASSDDGSRRA